MSQQRLWHDLNAIPGIKTKSLFDERGLYLDISPADEMVELNRTLLKADL